MANLAYLRRVAAEVSSQVAQGEPVAFAVESAFEWTLPPDGLEDVLPSYGERVAVLKMLRGPVAA